MSEIQNICSCGSELDTLICLDCGRTFCTDCQDIGISWHVDGYVDEHCPFCGYEHIEKVYKAKKRGWI